MSKKRKLIELIGRVIELKSDNKRYLVMPLELRGDEFRSMIDKTKGEASDKDLIYNDRVVLMPLNEVPEKRLKVMNTKEENIDFIVRNVKPEEKQVVDSLNESMTIVLNNVKTITKNLHEIRQLEKQQAEIEAKLKKLNDQNSVPFSKWARPAHRAHILELYKEDMEVINAKNRLEDEDRPLYKTSLTGKSNATKTDVSELLKVTDKSMFYRMGFAYRGAKASEITREKALDIWNNGAPGGGFLDMEELSDRIIINEYSSNDMY